MRVLKAHQRGLTITLACLLLGGCYFFQAVKEPIPTQYFKARSAATGLVVMMPGFGDGPQDFITNGFLDTVQQANPAFDVIAVNAHFGYYRNYSVVKRLHRDVIEPAQARYDEIWLVGISMGGFGAAAYGETYPDNIEGMILLSPFMGSDEVVEDVMAAPSLKQWKATELKTIEDVRVRRFYELWQFFQDYAESPQRNPKIYIGFGDEDHLRGANGLIADVLAAERSLILPGGHKWTVWKPLFIELANRAIGDR